MRPSWLQSGRGQREREHMWRLMYAAVSPLAVGCSEVDDVSVECETQVPLRSPPGAVNCCTRASASLLTPALVDGALRPVGASGGGGPIDESFALSRESPSSFLVGCSFHGEFSDGTMLLKLCLLKNGADAEAS